eukprot:m.87043 g.87043  ORF g.87043 m.87043 type:complete len:515 (-) comp13576_c0_seq2:151-1695(-)
MEDQVYVLARYLSSNAPSPDTEFLLRFLAHEETTRLLQMHQTAEASGIASLHPATSNALAPLRQLLQDLAASSANATPETAELTQLLSDPSLQAVLAAHDVIAGAPEATVRRGNSFLSPNIISFQLDTSFLPSGITLRGEGQPRRPTIARIAPGSAAAATGLAAGDELLEINGVNVSGEPVDTAADVLQLQRGVFAIRVRRGLEPGRRLFYRLLCDYSPTDQSWLPCPEGGLTVSKGDIVEVEDPTTEWMQAIVTDSRQTGLLPGPSLQESLFLASDPERKKKPHSRTVNHCGMSLLGAPTLESVLLSVPRPARFRPLVLIGPVGVGRNTIKTKLLKENPTLVTAAVPHTTRAAIKGEQHGREFFFVSRERMEADIQAMRFVEYGEYQNAIYGTSFQTIEDAIGRGLVCVVDVLPKALKVLRVPRIQPYVVFIRPPPLRRLRETRPTMSEEAVQRLLASAAKYEQTYGYLFDKTIVNESVEESVQTLLHIVEFLRTSPQWLPASWADTIPGATE